MGGRESCKFDSLDTGISIRVELRWSRGQCDLYSVEASNEMIDNFPKVDRRLEAGYILRYISHIQGTRKISEAISDQSSWYPNLTWFGRYFD